MKPRSGREYDPEELELFSKYRGHRAEVRPRKCREGARCWVAEGPPAITSMGICIGCKAKPIGFSQSHGKWSDAWS